MSCTRYETMISRMLDGELDPKSAHKLRMHLDDCAGCRALYHRLSALNESIAEMPVPFPASNLSLMVKRRIASLGEAPPARRLVPAWGRALAFAMVVVVALGVGNLAGTSLSSVVFERAKPDPGIELLVLENGQSFSDAILEIGPEGSQ
ncbi:MAG: zf-HC2 domain-containing protein [Thermodesulfobacteriota bacterium]